MHASDLFTAAYQSRPDGVWRAPGRANLIGEHTDYNGGLVLPFAIDRWTSAAVARTDRPYTRVVSAIAPSDVHVIPSGASRQDVSGWPAFVGGVLAALDVKGGADIAISSTVPLGAGLSSSAALTCSVAVAANELWGLGLDRRRLVEATVWAETTFVGAPTGGMDQMAALFGVEQGALFLDMQSGDAVEVPLHCTEAGLALLVVDTNVQHEHTDGEYGSRRDECEEAASRLGVSTLREAEGRPFEEIEATIADPSLAQRVRHIISENDRVREMVAALGRDDWDRVGELLNEGHASYRDDFQASCVEADLAADVLAAAGALGARLTGGGFGGSVLSLVPGDRIDELSDLVTRQFSDNGYRPPDVFTVAPSGAATRIQ